ncbi:hypothetical protein X797_011258 [Metarhizium robertsii]|uniref:Uncharacterized protein n=1 Tax=Metarhizium robertsii TaxID=568076 RepID=A0A014N7D4_9HYPO|nr:hypothetical protein X797_011258 [Metarhizium robertsii]
MLPQVPHSIYVTAVQYFTTIIILDASRAQFTTLEFNVWDRGHGVKSGVKRRGLQANFIPTNERNHIRPCAGANKEI